MKAWTAQELEKMFKVSRHTINRWIKFGYFPNAFPNDDKKTYKKWFVPDDDVKRFVRPKVGQQLKDYSHVSEAKIAEIIAFYESGGSQPEASRKFNLSRFDIERILRNSGVVIRRYTLSKQPRQCRNGLKKTICKKQIIELYKKRRLPITEIFKILEVSSATFYKILKFYQIPTRRFAVKKGDSASRH
jgi:DNA invertase Pin-like site-specific DNA recombinase